MSVFSAYARYYDLLYRDKDYVGEVNHVVSLLAEQAPGAESLLDLGCGTGRHAVLLAERGYRVHGIDRSAEMLTAARDRAAAAPPEVAARSSFSHGDITTARPDGPFDTVLALFHVVSYQATNDGVAALLSNVATLLRPGGLFVFDYWYGPAVLTERPVIRVKRMESEEIAVTRLAEPELHTDLSCVDVNYHVFVRDKVTRATEEIRETHRMRYLFLTEINLLARAAGFDVVRSREWATGAAPSPATWGVCSTVRKR